MSGSRCDQPLPGITAGRLQSSQADRRHLRKVSSQYRQPLDKDRPIAASFSPKDKINAY
jgi:hypothetical protein